MSVNLSTGQKTERVEKSRFLVVKIGNNRAQIIKAKTEETLSSSENLDQLEEVLCQCCQTLLKQPELIQGLTSFHWWSQIDA